MKSLEFYVNKVKYIEGIENADVSFIPALNRRRMSTLDKITAASLNECITNKTQNIIFSSKNGEFERLFKIIEQYNTENETSPAVFSGSVHNYAVSSYLMNIKKPLQYNAIASGKETIISGIISSIISNYDETLFVYSDIEDKKYTSLCLNISKKRRENSKKFRINFQNNSNNNKSIKEFAKFFSSDMNLITTNKWIIEREQNV